MSTITTVESIAELTAIQSPEEGQTVYVKSYYQGLAKGGGNFIFESSKLAIKNDVTIFNGWVRDLSGKMLTTDEAGITDDLIDNVVHDRIQTIFTEINDGFSIILKADYKSSKPLEIYQKSNLKIDLTEFKYTANSDWSFNFSIIPAGLFVPRGMIIAFGCPNIKISGGDITGVGSNNKTTQINVDPFQDGDSGIQLLECPRPIIENVKIRNTFAWSIIAEKSYGAIVRHNDISDVYHQSGINCVVNSNNLSPTYIYGNKVSRCALYGIELETYESNINFMCFDNIVQDCYTGITCTTGSNCITIGNIHDNNISKCGENGIWVTKVYAIGSDLHVNNNTIKSSFRGIHLSGDVRAAHFVGNSLIGTVPEDYFRRPSPDLLILKVISSNQFLISKQALTAEGINGTFYVNGIALTIASAVDTNENWGVHSTSGPMLLVTTNENVVVSDMLWRQLTRKIAAGQIGESGLTSSSGTQRSILWSNNIVSDFQYGILKQGGSTNIEMFEMFSNNTLDRCNYNSILQLGESTATRYVNNTISNTYVMPSLTDTAILSQVELKQVAVFSTITTRNDPSGPLPSVTYFSPKAQNILAVYIVPKSAATTGFIAININGSIFIAKSSGAGPQLIAANVKLNAGVNTIILQDTVGDFTYNGYELVFMNG